MSGVRRAAHGRREYDKGKPPSDMHERLLAEADTFDTAARLIEDPMVMLGLIPSWIWTPDEEALLDQEPPASRRRRGPW